MLALGSACARFGFERLGPNDDGGVGGLPGLGGPDSGRGGDGGASGGAGGEGGGGGSIAAGGQAADAGADASGGAGDGGAPPDGGAGGPVARCSDGTRNGDELGVDCGGSCPDCSSCSLGAPERLGDPNYAGNDLWSPRLSGDGLTLFFGLTVSGMAEQVAYATRPDRSASFGLGNLLPSAINQGKEGTPHPSLDLQRLYFYSERAGGGSGRDLYLATRAGGGVNFDDINVTPLTSLNGPELDYLPWLTADELTIYFVSGPAGACDIFRATRSSRNVGFEPPAPVTELNTSSDEGGITLSSDGRDAIFTSNRPGGVGARDLYRVTRASSTGAFGSPELLEAIDTVDNEIDPAFSPDGRELYFASNRDGGDSALYRATRSCRR